MEKDWCEIVVVKSCLEESDQEMVEFSILGEVRRGFSKITTLVILRVDFELFKTLVGKIPWESVLKGRGS